MKHAVAWMLLALLAAGCRSAGRQAASAPAPAPSLGSAELPPQHASMAPPEAASGNRTVCLDIHGLGCPLCATNAEKRVAKLPGVASTDVDLGTGKMTVGLAAGANPSDDDFQRAVKAAGFTLVRVERP